MKTSTLALLCCFALLSFNAKGQTLIDEAVFGVPSMVNELFAFEDGSRIIIENSLEECTLYNFKHFDSSGQLITYNYGRFRDKPSAYLWDKDSLVIITVGDEHDVPWISSMFRTVYNHTSDFTGQEDAIFVLDGGDNFIIGAVEVQWTAYDGTNIIMLTRDGELYWNNKNQDQGLTPIYDFHRHIIADHISLAHGNNDVELMINFHEDGFLYYLHYESITDVTLDSISVDNVVDIDKVNENLLVTTQDEIMLFSRDLNIIEDYNIGPEVEFVNAFNNNLYFKLLDTEVASDNFRVSVDIALFDGITMSWSDTVSIVEGPEDIHKVMLLDTVIHVLGSYEENNQAVIQRHTATQTGAVEDPVSDLEVVGYSIVSSSYTQWQSNPAVASAVLNVTLKKSDLEPNDNVLHLAKSGSLGWCRPHIMEIFQDLPSDDEFFDININLMTSIIREEGDSLVAKFNCSLFLPHGSPMNQNLDKNYLCPEVKFPKTVVSTETIEAKKLFEVFPNPITDELFLQFDPKNHLTAGNYRIYSNLGTLVGSGTLSVNNISIDTRALAPGIYTLIIIDDNLWGSRKFIKQ